MFLEEWSTEACQIQCSYYPKASFNIPRHQMQLNDEAIDDARRVKTLVDATEFLRNYNSHVSTDTYHVGGTLLKGITIQADSTQRLETMLDTAARNFKPAQLPVHVKSLVANVYPSSAKLTTDDASLGTSLVSVKAWLRQDTNGEVRKIIMKYGFDENGDCNVEGVTNEQVKNMTQEVTVALEGDQFKFPSTPPKGICTILQSNFDA